MCGQDDGAGIFLVFLKKQPVKELSVVGVQAENGLVEEDVGNVEAERQDQLEY